MLHWDREGEGEKWDFVLELKQMTIMFQKELFCTSLIVFQANYVRGLKY